MSATTAIASRARAPWLRLPRLGALRDLDVPLSAIAGSVRLGRGGELLRPAVSENDKEMVAGRARVLWTQLHPLGAVCELAVPLAAGAGSAPIGHGRDCLAARRRSVAHVFKRINGRRQE